MKLRSLTDKELQEEILWAKINMWVRSLEKRYEGQSNEEQLKEYNELHTIYRIYWDEAHHRGMVSNSSAELELKTETKN